MPGDMMVALGQSTVDATVIFAHSSDRPVGECPSLQLVPGRSFAPGETVQTDGLKLPQVRQTFSVLGSQPAGRWGYDHGVNEHGVALGRTSHRGKLLAAAQPLTGTDLVRLALERSRTAQQAVDFLTDSIERHGQGRAQPQAGEDSVFLCADARSAFLLEASGNHWVFQEIQQVRAASDVSLVRQDWNRISRGLAGYAINQGWWPADGSKLDFAGAISEDPVGACSALRRWGRAMLMLEQQSGHIDVAFVRRLLGDHYETMQNEVDPFSRTLGPVALCQHGTGSTPTYTAASLVVGLGQDTSKLTPVWCAFGPPCITVFFPLFLEGELPAARDEDTVWSLVRRLNDELMHSPQRLPLFSDALGRLQARIDQETEEFITENSPLKQTGDPAELKRRLAHFMQHHVETFLGVMDSLLAQERPAAVLSPT
jgi:dipeptidase